MGNLHVQHGPGVTTKYVERVADVAKADPRTVARYFAGLPLKPKSATRIAEAIATLAAIEGA
jgi:hypothetical protein